MVAALGGLVFFLIWLAVIVLVIAGFWRTFEKAGQPGWAAIIPIYNVIILLKVAGRPIWWILLYFIPIVNLIVSIMVSMDVARNFGKGVGFAVGLLFLAPIFYAILGFGSAEYNPSEPHGAMAMA